MEVAKDLVKARACAGCFLCPPPFGQYCWLDGLLRLGALDPRAPSRDDWPCARVFLARATFLLYVVWGYITLRLQQLDSCDEPRATVARILGVVADLVHIECSSSDHSLGSH